MYDYKEAVKKDVWEWLADDDGYRFNLEDYIKNGEWEKDRMVNDLVNMFTHNDHITGCDTGYDTPEDCKEYLEGNEDLACEAMTDALSDDCAYDNAVAYGEYVAIDSHVRLYVLPDVIREIVDGLPKPVPELEIVTGEAYNLVAEAVNEIFCKLQSKYGIESGDCPPDISIRIDNRQTELAELVAKTIIFEFGND